MAQFESIYPAGEDHTETGLGLPAEQVSKAFKWAGAGLSLALMAGLGYWGYKLALRDVTGVPVVLALEGPMRVAPEDPGGQLADHVGLAVNAVQAQGEAEAMAEEVALAPVAVDVIEADNAGLMARPGGTARGTDAPVAAALPAKAAASADMETGAILALADQIAAEATPLSQVAANAAPVPGPASSPEAEAEALAAEGTDTFEIAAVHPDVIPASVPGVARSVVPRPRPTGLKATPQGPLAEEEGSADGAVEVPVEEIMPGTSLVQLGAFDTLDTARSEWSRLAASLSDYLDPKSRVIEKAERGGRVFYRLRAAGFEDINDARRFCSALQSEGAECIPVIYR